MKKRIITAIVMAVTLIPLLVIDFLLPVLQVVAAILACIGSYEIIRMFEREKKYSWPVKIVILISTLLTYLCGMTIWGETLSVDPELQVYAFVDAKLGFALLMTSIAMQLSLLVFSKDFDAKDIGKSLVATFYVGFGIASIIALRIMGVRFIVYMFLITLTTDIFAYFFGMLFGKHKMLERISPKKTWEGAIGGTIMGTLIATLFAFLYGNLFPESLNTGDFKTIFSVFSGVEEMGPAVQLIVIAVVSFLASIAGQIGDLVASRMKRTYEIKDFGKLFPGHGGVLDRFDSSILVAMILLAAFLFVGVFFPIAVNEIPTMIGVLF
jgi:phosphatidate cytidylyltransferase